MFISDNYAWKGGFSGTINRSDHNYVVGREEVAKQQILSTYTHSTVCHIDALRF